MEPPISLSAEAVRDERVKVLHAIHPVHRGQRARPMSCADSTARARATACQSRGLPVRSRRCNPRSATETLRRPPPRRSTTGALRACRSTFRTGKRLPARVSEIAIQFNRPPLQLFQQAGAGGLEPNLLLVRIQPNEGISLQFQAKVPGADVRLGTVTMAFNYADYFARTPGDRVRDAALRLHDGRPDALPSRRHGGRRLAGRSAHPRRGRRETGRVAAPVLRRVLGTGRRRRASGQGWASVETSRAVTDVRMHSSEGDVAQTAARFAAMLASSSRTAGCRRGHQEEIQDRRRHELRRG